MAAKAEKESELCKTRMALCEQVMTEVSLTVERKVGEMVDSSINHFSQRLVKEGLTRDAMGVVTKKVRSQDPEVPIEVLESLAEEGVSRGFMAALQARQLALHECSETERENSAQNVWRAAWLIGLVPEDIPMNLKEYPEFPGWIEQYGSWETVLQRLGQ